MPVSPEDIQKAVDEGRFREAGELIERGFESNPQALLPYCVKFANYLLLAANWQLATRLLPQHANFFLESGWLESLREGKPVDKAGAPIPWYTYPAIDFIEPRLHREFRVFEFGSGMSTLWWAGRVASVDAVEHDAAWSKLVAAQLPANAQVRLQTDAEGYVGALEAAGASLTAAGGAYDVVVVDGEHRNACAQAAARQVKPEGAIVFDNSDRLEYSEGLRHLSEAGWLRIDFLGLCPCYAYKSCTSVFFRDTRWLAGAPLPAQQKTSIGQSLGQAMRQ